MTIDARDINRGLRATLWAGLLQDMTTVVLTAGLDLLDQWREPDRVLELLGTDVLIPADSPQAFYLREAIEEYVAGA